jgi:hypothetical protein
VAGHGSPWTRETWAGGGIVERLRAGGGSDERFFGAGGKDERFFAGGGNDERFGAGAGIEAERFLAFAAAWLDFLREVERFGGATLSFFAGATLSFLVLFAARAVPRLLARAMEPHATRVRVADGGQNATFAR